jgi:hypothetical protein
LNLFRNVIFHTEEVVVCPNKGEEDKHGKSGADEDAIVVVAVIFSERAFSLVPACFQPLFNKDC